MSAPCLGASPRTTACVLCHANFTAEFFTRTNNPGQWVGALVLAVPIR